MSDLLRFLTVCPSGKSQYPIEPCQKAINKINKKKDDVCPWFVDDEKSNYCFWLYISRPENKREHILREIAKLMHSSTINVKIAQDRAFRKFLKIIRKYEGSEEIIRKIEEIIEKKRRIERQLKK